MIKILIVALDLNKAIDVYRLKNVFILTSFKCVVLPITILHKSL